MSELKPIVGYLTLTERGETKFIKGPDYPGTWVNREVLTCGHTYITPTYEGRLSTAQARRCKKCASGKPEDIPQARILAWMQGEDAGRAHWVVAFENGDPDMYGPFLTDAKRVEWARRFWRKVSNGPEPLRLDVYASGIPHIDTFTVQELQTVDEGQVRAL